jgi:hypothetical protein
VITLAFPYTGHDGAKDSGNAVNSDDIQRIVISGNEEGTHFSPN